MTSNAHVPGCCDCSAKNAYSTLVFPTGNDDPGTYPDSAPASLPKLSNATGSSKSTAKPLEPGAAIRRISFGHPNMVSVSCDSTLMVSVSDHKEKGFIYNLLRQKKNLNQNIYQL